LQGNAEKQCQLSFDVHYKESKIRRLKSRLCGESFPLISKSEIVEVIGFNVTEVALNIALALQTSPWPERSHSPSSWARRSMDFLRSAPSPPGKSVRPTPMGKTTSPVNKAFFSGQ